MLRPATAEEGAEMTAAAAVAAEEDGPAAAAKEKEGDVSGSAFWRAAASRLPGPGSSACLFFNKASAPGEEEEGRRVDS